MKFLPLTFIVFLFLGNPLLYSQEQSFISGTVYEVEENAPLPGANIYWESEPQKGVVSDINGNFNLPIIALPAKIVISCQNIHNIIRQIKLHILLATTNMLINRMERFL